MEYDRLRLSAISGGTSLDSHRSMPTPKSTRSWIRWGFLAALIGASLSCSSTTTANDASPPPGDATDTPATDGAASEPCATIAGHTFTSVDSMECGLAADGGINSCPWTVMFSSDGTFRWRYSDIGQQGTYRCEGGALLAQGVTASYDATTGHLTWEGADYVRQP
jgi:hypothetical protein